MFTATVIRDKDGKVYARYSKQGAQTGGGVTVVDILQQKDGEGAAEFKKRVDRYIKEMT